MILARGADVKATRATGGFLFANPLAPRLLRLLRQEGGASNGDAPYLATWLYGANTASWRARY